MSCFIEYMFMETLSLMVAPANVADEGMAVSS
jgi:hypothetical protein